MMERDIDHESDVPPDDPETLEDDDLGEAPEWEPEDENDLSDECILAMWNEGNVVTVKRSPWIFRYG